jgi:hypothetical protein
VSEITVNADHTTVHRHPRAILEVRRILLEHLSAAKPEMTSPERVVQRTLPARQVERVRR